MEIQKEIIREVKVYCMTILTGQSSYSQTGIKIYSEEKEFIKKLLNLFIDCEFKTLKEPDRTYDAPDTPHCFYSEPVEAATSVAIISLHRSKLEAAATHATNVDLYKKGLLKSKKKKSDD